MQLRTTRQEEEEEEHENEEEGEERRLALCPYREMTRGMRSNNKKSENNLAAD